MYFRKRGAPVVLVVLVACLVMSFAQATFGDGCTSLPCQTRQEPTEPTCSRDAVSVISITRGSHEVTINWKVLESACQIEHIAVRYKSNRKLACPKKHLNEPYVMYAKVTNIVGQNALRIVGLEPYTSYRIDISANYTSYGPAGWKRTWTSTLSSAPPSLNVTVHTRMSTQLELMWDPLTCDNVNGLFSYYEAVLSDQTIRSNEITSSSVTFDSLNPCTSYTISLTAVNHGYSSTAALSAPTKAKVIRAELNTTGSGSLSLTWNIDRDCGQRSREYNITYQLTRLNACEGFQRITPSQTLVSWQMYSSQSIFNSVGITGLKAFSTYEVHISITGIADSAYDHVLTQATLPKDPLGVPEESLLHDQNRTHLSFSWPAPQCEDLHGSFHCYNYALRRVNNGEGLLYSECIRDIQNIQRIFTTNELKACTLHRFEVQVVTGSDEEYKRSGWITEDASTPTRAPGEPRIITAIPSAASVSVRWEAPNDSPCEVEEYYVTHELLYRDMCKRLSLRTEESSTYVRRHNIGRLYSNSVYRVCVRGSNKGGDGLPTCVNFTTGVKAPSKPPKRVECTNSSYDRLTFTWDKPRCGDRNGPITQYEFRLSAQGRNDSRDGYVAGNDNGGIVTFTKLIPATTYYFEVRAENNDLPGDNYGTVEVNTSKASYYPPRDVVVTPLNGTTAAVEWLAPYISDFNITGYRVECWQSGFKANTSIVASHEVVACGTRCSTAEKITGLKPATNHSIQVIAEYKYEERKSRVVEFRTLMEVRASPSRQNAAMTPVLVSIFVIIVVLLLVIAAMLYSRKTDRKIFSSEWFPISFPDIRNVVRRARAAPGKSTQMSNNRSRNHTEREQNGRGLEMEMAGVVSQINNHANQEMESNMSCAIYENMPAPFTKHQAIPVGQLLGYVARRNADGSNSLDEDFKSLPSQKLHSQDIALKEENKEKNRFTNILPYDHSRVKLSMVHGDPHSDYINASFIDGYKSPKKYIAAQGPNTASVDSFWRMVWQYDCRKIVMLTNLREANKKKCEKYWPAERESYGDIWMTLVKEEINDNYTVRYFNLVCNNTGRDVVQYHYTSWPDMGVPEFSAHLMSFVRITREPLKSHHKGPTIVHCSAGVGRTGTFLTLDAMLDQVQAEQAMDIHSFITSMRQNRPLMVQTKKQYRFIYEALLQDQTCGDTGISRDAFGETYQSLISRTTGMTGIKQQFELLQALTISPHDEETAAARSDDNVGKNRFSDKVPGGRTRPFLMTEVEGGNDYINASFLPGYVSKNQYIGTQTPLPNTVIDFWRLVVDYKVNTIVMLHGNSRDKTYAQYWPTEGSKRYGPYTVDLLKEEYNRPIMHRTLEVTKMDSKKASSKKVKLLQLASCPPQSETPPTLTDVMDLHRALLSALGTTVWKEGDSPLLIHCRDGEGMTGAFCAFLAALDHLDAKQTVDVFHACRKLRTSRPGAVASLAQYQFIYEAVKSFMISSSIYENMAKIV